MAKKELNHASLHISVLYHGKTGLWKTRLFCTPFSCFLRQFDYNKLVNWALPSTQSSFSVSKTIVKRIQAWIQYSKCVLIYILCVLPCTSAIVWKWKLWTTRSTKLIMNRTGSSPLKFEVMRCRCHLTAKCVFHEHQNVFPVWKGQKCWEEFFSPSCT